MKLNLMPRDKEALILLYYNRFLSSSQLGELFYRYTEKGENKNFKTIACRRMQKMISHKLVTEYTPYANDKKVYALDDSGVALVCSWLGLKYEGYARRKSVIEIGYIGHALAINDFYIELKKHYTIKMFKVERHNRRTFTYNKLTYTFQPDAFFVISNKAYYLELDRGTETIKKFMQKVEKYEAFYAHEVFKEDWNNGNARPVILVLCNDKKRTERLQNALKSKLEWRFIPVDNIKNKALI